MASDQEKYEKQERADRLKLARVRANLRGATDVYKASGGEIEINTYKAHENGRNGYSVADARQYASLFGVPITWLYLGIGKPEDVELPGASKLLKQAFASVADSPENVQTQVISFIEFQTGQKLVPSQQQPNPPDDLYEHATPRRA